MALDLVEPGLELQPSALDAMQSLGGTQRRMQAERTNDPIKAKKGTTGEREGTEEG